MGVGLGWQRMCNIHPYIDGMAWNDGISRNNANVVNYSFNLCMHVPTTRAWWNYAWYVDMACGSNVSNNRMVKARHSGSNLIISNVDYYQSSYNGNFSGSIGVGGKETQIVLRGTFHDSAGNWGHNTYWGCSIPTASSLSNITGNVENITTETASVTGKITSRGNYATITKWQLEYGIVNYNENTKTISGDSLTRTWEIDSLTPDKTYKYRITSWNSAGYSKSMTGTFKTLEEDIGYVIIEDKPIKPIRAWVISPDGTKRKVRKIKQVEPL